MKRTMLRTTAAALAAIAPATLAINATFTAPAIAQEAPAVAPAQITKKGQEGFDAYADREWVKTLKRYRDAGYTNVHVYEVYSPAMERTVPIAVIQPSDVTKREGAPTLYLLNGADGGEGSANWIRQTDVITYYGGNENPTNGTVGPGIGANIVIPMAGKFSYYTDWVNPVQPNLSEGKQLWETFMTKELPQAIETDLKANGKRAIAGLSMSGTTTLLYAQHNPGFYNSIASFSGCAATTTGLAPAFIDITLGRGGVNMANMWGSPFSPTAAHNDALLNAEKLRNQENIYVSNGSGLAGEHDLPSSQRVNGNLSSAATVIVEGGVIEAVTNDCTHRLRAKTDALGIPVTYNFRPTGTHQWGYWEQDMRDYWPILVKGLGTDAVQPSKEADTGKSKGAGFDTLSSAGS